MDPQQRLLLEVAWEALERAGQPPDRLAGSLTGVFVGISTNDYSRLFADSVAADPHTGTGNAFSVAAGRLSYTLGLQGPSLAVDTACSSSLVAVHLACQALRNRECDLALVAGVNLTLSPVMTVYFSKLHVLSPAGRCKTFDASADGYVRGEGCGVVVLKRLADALADGETPWATIRGSAVNHAGRSNGLTAPNGQAQRDVIRRALRLAAIAPERVGYVEAHGTGTPLGDPVELQALAEALDATADATARRGRPLWVGSVKTNIGHLESAAGIAGLIKAVLCLHHGRIPPHLHLNRPNPHLPWDRLALAVPTGVARPWPEGDEPRVVGVSSFGFSGTNAHVVLEQAEAPATATADAHARPDPGGPRLLVLSAKGEPALRALAGRYAQALAAEPTPDWDDTCAAAATGRAQLPDRLALVADTPRQAAERLLRWHQAASTSDVTAGRSAPGRRPRLALLVPGQGAQYAGMGRQLYDAQPIFRNALRQCDDWLRPTLPQPLLAVLGLEGPQPPAGLLDRTRYAQPALVAMAYALGRLWQSWGIEPDAVMGHSVGEIAAACVAGVLDWEAGLRLAAERGRLMDETHGEGAMLAVAASEVAVAGELDHGGGALALAAINGPEAVVLSGPRAAVADAAARLAARGIATRALNCAYAFHSPLIEPAVPRLIQAAAGLVPRRAAVTLVSNLSGDVVAGPELDAAYWGRHARQPVRFAAGLETLVRRGCRAFLELGPGATLVGLGRRTTPEAAGAGPWLPSLRRGHDERRTMLESLGTLWAAGTPVAWTAVYPGRRRVSLPTYPFQRERYWGDRQDLVLKEPPPAQAGGSVHPLLGCVAERGSAGGPVTFDSKISLSKLNYLEDHRIYGMAVMPATAYLEMALAAAAATLGGTSHILERVGFHEALILPELGDVALRLSLERTGEDSAEFQVLSQGAGEMPGQGAWTVHASGSIRVERSAADAPLAEPFRPDAVQEGCSEEGEASAYYQKLRERGFEYGPAFQGIEHLWRRNGRVLGRVGLVEPLRPDESLYRLHPALLDSCFQVAGTTAEHVNGSEVYLPIGVDLLRFTGASASRVWAQIVQKHAANSSSEVLTNNLELYDEAGHLVARVEGLTLKSTRREVLLRLMQRRIAGWFYELQWRAKGRGIETTGQSPVQVVGRWLILADRGGLAVRVARLLEERGGECVLAYAARDGEAAATGQRTVASDQPEDLAELIRELDGEGRPYRGILDFWGVDSATTPKRDIQALLQAQVFGCAGLVRLLQALSTSGAFSHPELWQVTRGTQAVNDGDTASGLAQATLWGIGRVVAIEHPQISGLRVDLDPAGDAAEAEQLVEDLIAGEHADHEIAYRQGHRYVHRLVRASESAGGPTRALHVSGNQPFRLEKSTNGALEGLTLQPAPRRQPSPGEVEIRVRATGLNFRDVLNAMNLYPGEAGPLGGECAGMVAAIGEGVEGLHVGQAVVALATGSFGKFAMTRADFVVPKPDHLSFEQAATIPITFLTASYALHRLARISAGDRVLIHAAAGGVGMAAVQLARGAGAEIFATASSPAKHHYLRSQGVTRIMNSRTLDFADEILAATAGEGIDIVLNSLNGEFIPRSLSLLRPGGRFCEIGKIGIWDQDRVDKFKPDVSFFPIAMDQLALADPALVRGMLREIIEAADRGTIQPLPTHSFPIQEAVAAYRYMAQAKHMGKIVVTQEEELPGPPEMTPFGVRSDGTYLITGGLGGLGLQVAQWLADRGANHLLLLSRRPPADHCRDALDHLARRGVHVHLAHADVADADALHAALRHHDHLRPPLRGVIHAAGLLDDCLIARLDFPRMAAVMAPKVAGAWNLHRLTRDDQLDFFVMFSSVASVLGSPGQAAYAAGNAFLDALAAHRRAEGLPGQSINWGPWSGAGMAARISEQDRQRWAAFGIGEMAPAQGLEALGRVMSGPGVQVVVAAVDWVKMLGQSPGGVPGMLEELAREVSQANKPSAEWLEFMTHLESVPPAKRRERLADRIKDLIAGVLGLDPSWPLDPQQPLNEMGFDSLMAIDLTRRLAANTGLSISPTILFNHSTIEAVSDYIYRSLFPDDTRVVADSESKDERQRQDRIAPELDRLSHREVETLLEEELEEIDAMVEYDHGW